MKKLTLIAFATLLLCGCKDNTETFAFKGVVCGWSQCSLSTASISEMDFGYIVSLISPDTIGINYTDAQGRTHPNCVLLYRTRYRFYDGDSISGTMYLDDDYSKAYCSYHDQHGLPEGVCYRLD